ncbi:nucleotide exchange factor GrpE [Ktedonobacteria bacterium brp13]|nr:nucleotide exchange factor GrpE [Ktedonobacteria bacterium brp13]
MEDEKESVNASLDTADETYYPAQTEQDPSRIATQPLSATPLPTSSDETPEAPEQTIETALATLQTYFKASLQELRGDIQTLSADFDSKIKVDSRKDQFIDTLHKDLQLSKAGEHFTIRKPLFLDLIDMYKDLERLIESLQQNIVQEDEAEESTGQQSTRVFIKNLQSFQESIETILARYDVEAYELEGDSYTPAQQMIIRVHTTNNPALDKHIARRVRKGFRYEQRILRKEMVDVLSYKEE